MRVKQRLVSTPNTIELITFKEAYDKENPKVNNPFGREGLQSHLSVSETQQLKLDNRVKILKRNSTLFWRLFNSNKGQYKHKDKFMTLTFRDNINDIDQCDNEFKKFIKRLRYNVSDKIEYQSIRELQQRGALHYHIIVYNMPYTPYNELLTLWATNNPFVDQKKPSGLNIRSIDDGISEVSNYLTSYMIKDLLENRDFLTGRKTILKSRGLKTPDVVEFDSDYIVPKVEEIKKGITFLDSKVTYYRFK